MTVPVCTASSCHPFRVPNASLISQLAFAASSFISQLESTVEARKAMILLAPGTRRELLNEQTASSQATHSLWNETCTSSHLVKEPAPLRVRTRASGRCAVDPALSAPGQSTLRAG